MGVLLDGHETDASSYADDALVAADREILDRLGGYHIDQQLFVEQKSKTLLMWRRP